MYMNVTGNAKITCEKSGLTMQLSFDGGKGWHFKTIDVHLDGYILEGKTKLRAVYGNWTYFFATCAVDSFKHEYSTYQQLFRESLDPYTVGFLPLLVYGPGSSSRRQKCRCSQTRRCYGQQISSSRT